MKAKTKIRGRPGKLVSTEDLHELGKDLLDWLDNPVTGANEIYFVGWYYDRHGLFRDDWKKLTQRDLFRPYYEIALKKMVRNIVKNENLAQSYGNRYLGMYDVDLRAHEKLIKQEEAELKRSQEVSFVAFAENLNKLQNFFDHVKAQAQIEKNPVEAKVD